MPILGFSDATLAVVKRGPEEVREQGLLCDHIGMNVCPRVLRFLPDGYEMEILEQPHSRSLGEALGILGKLAHHVWPRRSYKQWDRDWLAPLHDWIRQNNCLWGLLEVLESVYPDEPTDGYCLIHGDPTLANLMLRKGERVITDPMPRMEYRREIPNRLEVDLGKLVQSAVGWERMLGCESSMWEEHERLLMAFSEDVREKAVLWGAIHLARVSVRAPKRGKHKIASWAKDASQKLTASLLNGKYS